MFYLAAAMKMSKHMTAEVPNIDFFNVKQNSPEEVLHIIHQSISDELHILEATAVNILSRHY